MLQPTAKIEIHRPSHFLASDDKTVQSSQDPRLRIVHPYHHPLHKDSQNGQNSSGSLLKVEISLSL